MNTLSGIGVLDKTFLIMRTLQVAPMTLNELVTATGITRATLHRLCAGLCEHQAIIKTPDGNYGLGPALVSLGDSANNSSALTTSAMPELRQLRERTGESVQLFVRAGMMRLCVVALDSPHELRTIVSRGALLALDVGSAGRVLTTNDASNSTNTAAGDRGDGHDDDTDAKSFDYDCTASVEERAPGVASVSAPIRDRYGNVVAAVSISGPIERMTNDPSAQFGDMIEQSAARISRWNR